MQLINQVQNILCSAAVQRNNVCSAVAKSLRRCISAASHLLSKAVSKGLSACFDVAFRFPFVRSVRSAPLLSRFLPLFCHSGGF